MIAEEKETLYHGYLPLNKVFVKENFSFAISISISISPTLISLFCEIQN